MKLISTVTLAASAQPSPDYGFDWVTVGNPGNAHASADVFFRLPRDAGGVDYSFRITNLPLDLERWVEFAHAFDGVATAQERVWLDDASPYTYRDTASGEITILGGYERFAATPNYMLAARYCNWLHNDRQTDAWAFADGAYDTSRFVQNAGGRWMNTGARREDARYWIPTLDEHAKASYYDPDRYGPGEGGYWLYPHQSDDPPVYGPPGSPGAQSGAGIDLPFGNWYFDLPLGLYPDTVSAYGLLDVSGGIDEWTDTTRQPWIDQFSQYIKWSKAGQGTSAEFGDQLSNIYAIGRFVDGPAGFRIATVVPAPGAFALAPLLLVRASRRRR